MKPIHPPIVQSTIYHYDANEEMRNAMLSGDPFFYMRSGNPTVQEVAREVAALEKGEAGLLFASGMAAISCSLITLLSSGDHVIAEREMFSQTRSLLDTVLTKFGVQVSYMSFSESRSLLDAIRSNTKLLFVESPSNPMLNVVDLSAAAAVAREVDALLLVDSTLATPLLQNPLDLGVSLVLHSGTKYLAGHSDVLSGVVVGNKDLISRIHAVQKLTGGVLDPHAAYLLHRGLKTLALRMSQVCLNAMYIAEFLCDRPEIKWVRYPFLENHPSHHVARKQMKSGGGLLSFELQEGLEAARKFVDALKVIRLATSFGGTDSTIEIPYDLKKIRAEQKDAMGLIRLSVGIEDIAILTSDIEQALQACTR